MQLSYFKLSVGERRQVITELINCMRGIYMANKSSSNFRAESFPFNALRAILPSKDCTMEILIRESENQYPFLERFLKQYLEEWAIFAIYINCQSNIFS